MLRRVLSVGCALCALTGLSVSVSAHPGHGDAAGAAAVSAEGSENIRYLFNTPAAPGVGSTAASLEAPRFGAWGIDLAQKRTDIKPGDDFFRHVNGRWLDTFEIPADKSDFGAFNALGDLSDARVKAIIEEAAARPSQGSSQQIGDLYAAFMDLERIERAGLAPLQPDLERIARAADARALAVLLAANPGMPQPIPYGVGVDRRDTKRHQLNVFQGGLGLPERDFYLSDGSNFPQVRAAYRTYAETLFRLAGASPEAAAAAVERVMAFETAIARVHFTRAENRDPTKTLNTRTIAQLEAEAPGYPFAAAFTAYGINPADVADLNVGQPAAVAGIARIWAETPIETLRDWARLRLLAGASDLLPKDFRDARFAFQKVQTGQPVERPREKRGGDLVGNVFGDAIGQIYVARYFPPEAKREMDRLVANLKVAMRARIQSLEWMGPDTKAQALAKLDAFTVKIGVPEVWDDTSSIRIDRNDLIGNMRRAAAWARADNIADLKRPVDKREWGMTPQTVNAYYSPLNNEIVFPAAILQPPFFDVNADPAVNYGAIGGVIGHEISHGFDDQGRRFAADGAQRDWWTAEDNTRFNARADRLVEQYNKFEPLPGLFVQGRVSLGENIADLAGLTVARDAYLASLGGRPAPVIDGLTGEQRFFLGWGQVWRFKARDERMRQRVATAPHSPPQFRVNGVVRNMDAWYAAFDVKPGDALYLPPEERVRIW